MDDAPALIRVQRLKAKVARDDRIVQRELRIRWHRPRLGGLTPEVVVRSRPREIEVAGPDRTHRTQSMRSLRNALSRRIQRRQARVPELVAPVLLALRRGRGMREASILVRRYHQPKRQLQRRLDVDRRARPHLRQHRGRRVHGLSDAQARGITGPEQIALCRQLIARPRDGSRPRRDRNRSHATGRQHHRTDHVRRRSVGRDTQLERAQRFEEPRSRIRNRRMIRRHLEHEPARPRDQRVDRRRRQDRHRKRRPGRVLHRVLVDRLLQKVLRRKVHDDVAHPGPIVNELGPRCTLHELQVCKLEPQRHQVLWSREHGAQARYDLQVEVAAR